MGENEWHDKQGEDCRQFGFAQGRHDSDFRLYIILFFSIIFGLTSGLFWIANFWLRAHRQRRAHVHQSCTAVLLHKMNWRNPTGRLLHKPIKSPPTRQTRPVLYSRDEPDRITWEDEEWIMVTKRGKNFDAFRAFQNPLRAGRPSFDRSGSITL